MPIYLVYIDSADATSCHKLCPARSGSLSHLSQLLWSWTICSTEEGAFMGFREITIFPLEGNLDCSETTLTN